MEYSHNLYFLQVLKYFILKHLILFIFMSDGIHSETPMEDLEGTDMIYDFALDYMHCICLGEITYYD